MYISKLSIQGYKNTQKKSTISFNKGLNVLLGENGCGKTAVINALRLLFREPESNYACSPDDFYCSLDRSCVSDTIEIDAVLSELTEDEKIVFLSWCNANFDAHLHLRITENPTKLGSMKRKYWGSESTASIFEEDTFDRVECIYLPPLRDAESKLSAGRRSRLAWLLKKKYGDNTESLVANVAEFNDNIVQNKDGKYTEIQEVKASINGKIVQALGTRLGQSVNLQFSETTFNRIIENIRMVFFPLSGETDIKKFRDLATNSLGYNNLLYIATVFAELELIKDSDIFTILLIEEPEAHLHPQLQVKFIKYLETLADTLPNAQVIVSTHSPVLASSVKIDRLIHLAGKEDSISSTTISQKDFDNSDAESYINRWLDVTKSTMLFSRGIILVEGIAEALVLPKLAEIVLQKYNQNREEPLRLASTLDAMGVSVININGINFKYFMKLFGNFEGSSGPNIPIFCSGLTDRDPGKDDSNKDIYPEKDKEVESKNPIVAIKGQIDSNEWTRLFVSPLKTFEYDLATYNPMLLATVLKSVWPTQKGSVCIELDKIIARENSYSDTSHLADDAKYIYKHIEDSEIGKGVFAYALAEKITADFVVPEYISNAILWACGGKSL
ncbi:MAG: AAA family ATPase [Eubacteriales bacterium]|nr:AAA family ATPase [Eubacteriales bacterium]